MMSELGIGFGFFAMIMLFWIFFVGILVGLFVLWVFMIIDAAQRKFPEQNQQVVWILVIVLAGFIGAIIYYFVVKRKEKSLLIKRRSKRKRKK